jgi:tetraprenyl-beta-curcumene synthase
MPAARRRVTGATAFGRAACDYWGSVFGLVRSELVCWQVRATQIPDPRLRRFALQALAKRSNMEGAAAFATFVPAEHRVAVVKAAVAFQCAYNYLDLLAEQPNARAVLNSATLHAALPAALLPGGGMLGWYEHCQSSQDGGYLQAMVDDCRDALCSLPSYPAVRPMALRAAKRVALFQSFNCGERQGDHDALRRWAIAHTPPGSGLAWWETAGSAGSSLGVYVMLAAAAQPSVEMEEVEAIERLYFPWVGALHSLLDQLIDVEEDERTGQRNLTRFYSSAALAATRIGWLAGETIERTRMLLSEREGERHGLIATAMAAMYLAAPQSREPGAIGVRKVVLRELGPLAWLAIAVFKVSDRLRGPERPMVRSLRGEDPSGRRPLDRHHRCEPSALESQPSESPVVRERSLCEVPAGR